MAPTTPPEPLDPDMQAQLAQGRHEQLAARLAAAGRHALAGWVLEQIWEFAGACEHYARAGRVTRGALATPPFASAAARLR